MKKHIHLFLIIAIVSLVCFNAQAQSNYNYIFTADSLKGFNEATAKQKSLQNNCFGNEYKVSMYQQKRDFVDSKYSIGDYSVSRALDPHAGYKYGGMGMLPAAPPATINPACYNVDFETGDFTGWELSNGISLNSLTMAGCCPSPAAPLSVVISGGFDPIEPLLALTSPFTGTNVARINDSGLGAKVERISQTFSVTSTNAIFQIAFSGVLEAAGHICSQQPYMNISVIDTTGAVLPCPQIFISAPSALCSQDASITAGWALSGAGTHYWHDWEIKTIDLSPYIGSYITIQITVGDCTQSGHYGYGYFDCRCLPLNLNVTGSFGGSEFDVTPSVPVIASLCGGSSVLFKAPDGLDGYSWDGPFGSGISATPTQTISTVTPGEYTLTMSPPGACFPITKVVILNDSPDFGLGSTLADPTCTNAVASVTVNTVGGTPVFSFKWNPPVAFSEAAYGLKPGTDYSVNVSDGYGCQHTITVNVPPFPGAPDYTINPLSGLISCKIPTLSLTSVTGTNTTGGWMPTLDPTITVMAPGTYSCVLTNTMSGCKATVPVIVNSSLSPPTATPNITCGAVTTTLNASAEAGISLGWLAPTTPAPTNVGNPGVSNAVGIFTLTATDLVSGCKQTYTVSNSPPTITLTAVPASQTITCYDPTAYVLAESSAVGYTVKWDDGSSATYENPFGVAKAGTFTATVISSGGCVASQTIQIYSDQVVDAMITAPSTIIPCSTGSVALSVSSTTNGAGPYSYSWLPSTPTFTSNPFIVTAPGIYSVTAFNAANGCTVTVTQEIIMERIDALFTPSPVWGIVPLPVDFDNFSFNGVDYSWDLGNGMTANTFTTSTVYNTAGTYTIVLTANNGFCTDTAIRYVRVELISSLEVPNVFTPNGDGSNDLFTLKAVNMGDISMTIFDRWGIKMYEQTHNGHVSWDGVNKGGHTVNDGTYFYVIKATGLDNKAYDLKGNITVFIK